MLRTLRPARTKPSASQNATSSFARCHRAFELVAIVMSPASVVVSSSNLAGSKALSARRMEFSVTTGAHFRWFWCAGALLVGQTLTCPRREILRKKRIFVVYGRYRLCHSPLGESYPLVLSCALLMSERAPHVRRCQRPIARYDCQLKGVGTEVFRKKKVGDPGSSVGRGRAR